MRTLARRRHFGLAAKDLGVTQPALTRSLKQLETDLGVRLFDRQGVTPTLFGEIVLRHGVKALVEFGELMREIELAKGLEIGELSVAAGPYASDISVERAIGQLIGKSPKLRVEFRGMSWRRAVDEVLDGAVDLAIAEMPEMGADDLDVTPLRLSQMRFFCRPDHPLARKELVTADDTFAFPWVGPGLPSRIMQIMPDGERPCGYYDAARDKFRCRVFTGLFSSVKAVVMESDEAIGAAIPYQIDREVREGAFVLLPPAPPWLRLNYGFLLKRGRTPSPAAKTFMEIVRRIEATIA